MPPTQRFSATCRSSAKNGLDLAILPIGDYYTMGPDDALRAVKLLRPRFVLPIHYNTFPPIAQDAGAWAARVKNETAASRSSSSRVNGSIFLKT